MKEFPDTILLSKDSESGEILDYWLLKDETDNTNVKYLKESVVNDIITVAEDHAYMAGANWQSKQDETLIEHIELSAYSSGFRDAVDKACEWLKNNLSQKTSVISGGCVHINFDNAIEEFRKAMED